MDPPAPEPNALRKRQYWPALVLAGVAVGFLLWSEHRAHLLGAVPYLLLLACPIAHWSLHGRGHGEHGAGRPGAEP